MIKLFPTSKQDFFRIFALLLIPASFAAGCFLQAYLARDIRTELGALHHQLRATEAELKKSRDGYERLEKDRENILIQTKRFIQENNRLQEIEKAHKEMIPEHKAILRKTKKLGFLSERLEKERKDLKNRLSLIEAERNELKKTLATVTDEREQDLAVAKTTYQKDLESITAERDRLQKELKDLRKNMQKTVEGLEKKLNRSKNYQGKYEEEKRRRETLEKEAKGLKKQLKSRPGEMKELANQNRTLLEETAKMHYNLGVFYAKEKQFKRALPEFERTIALNPEQAGKAHFNLGYIYADQYEDFERASDHFRKFLRLEPDDESTDWAKNYLESQGLYDGKIIEKL